MNTKDDKAARTLLTIGLVAIGLVFLGAIVSSALFPPRPPTPEEQAQYAQEAKAQAEAKASAEALRVEKVRQENEQRERPIWSKHGMTAGQLAACNTDAAYRVSNTVQREFASVRDIPGGIAYDFRAETWDVVGESKNLGPILTSLADADACELQRARRLEFYRPDGSKVGSIDSVHGPIGFVYGHASTE